MEAYERKPNLTTCSIEELYDRLAEILKRRRPDRLVAFREFLRHEQETPDHDRPTTGRRPR